MGTVTAKQESSRLNDHQPNEKNIDLYPTMESQNSKFLFYTVLTLGLTVVALVILGRLDTYYGVDKYSNIGGIIQGSLGIAVSFGGAFAAVRIAQLGIRIVEREKRRDDYVNYNDIVDRTILPFKRLAGSLQSLFDVHLMYSLDIQKLHSWCNEDASYIALDEKGRLNLLNDNVFNKEYNAQVVAALRAIAENLELISTNHHAYLVWLHSYGRLKKEFLKSNDCLGRVYSYPITKIDLGSDLNDLIALIRMRANLIERHRIRDFDILRAAALSTTLLTQDDMIDVKGMQSMQVEDLIKLKEAKIEPLIGYRLLFDIGLIVWSEFGDLEAPLTPVHNVAGAFLHDILLALPDKDDVEAVFEGVFGQMMDLKPTNTPGYMVLKRIGVDYWYSNLLQQSIDVCLKRNIAFCDVPLMSLQLKRFCNIISEEEYGKRMLLQRTLYEALRETMVKKNDK